jgi:hypothetical protein
VRRYQYTAIDDATRVRALKVYRRHPQANAIDFINYVVEKFPFRICTIQTDRVARIPAAQRPHETAAIPLIHRHLRHVMGFRQSVASSG